MLERREFIKGGAMGAMALTAGGVMVGLTTMSANAKEAEEAKTEGEAKEVATEKTSNRVCELLGIEKPVFQAPMTFLTDATLCAAVSNAGGLGMLGTNAGQTDQPEDSLEAMRAQIQEVKALTDKPFAVNNGGGDEFLAMLQEEGVNIIYQLGLGTKDNDYAVDTEGIKKLKDAGFTVIFRDVNCTVDAMVKAQEAGADIIIASGYGNGGHMSETRVTLPTIIAEAREKITVPLMASGCIATPEYASALAAMGIEGVFVGTRFNASEESPCSDEAKQVLIDTRAEELVEFRGGFGLVHATNTPASQEWVAASNAGADSMEMGALYIPMFRAMRVGEIDDYAVNASDSINAIDSIKPCKEIVDELGAVFVA